jgi:hypothetical protein
MFTVIGQEIVTPGFVPARCPQYPLPGGQRLPCHPQPLPGAELLFRTDMFSVKRRVMQNPAIRQYQTLVHHKPFAARHYVAG